MSEMSESQMSTDKEEERRRETEEKQEDRLKTGRKFKTVDEEPSQQFFRQTVKNKRGGIFACTFCNHTFAARKFDRFHNHLIKRCPKLPPDVRKDYLEKVEEKGIRAAVGNTDSDKNYSYRRDEEEEEEIFEDDEDEMIDEKDEAVKILQGLLSKVKSDSTRRKKPLSEYCEADFDREMKELNVKEARLRCKELEDRSRFYEQFSKQMNTITVACDLYIQEHSNRHPDSALILQQAFNETINSPDPTTIQ